jgi:thiol:disulfide interchange protein
MWMERVKVVMGFLVLAAMFKYLASIDQVMRWNLLTRDRFLAAWMVLFGLAGLYLLGLLRLPGVKRDDPLGAVRLLIGAALVAFAISLAPGMFGGRLGELDAYVPAAGDTGSVIGGSSARGEQLQWMTNRYSDALAKARQENKLVLVAFTGYACTNCHWMQANMFTRPEIAAAMKEFVLVELYTDGADEASRQNQALEESKFATVAIPYYAIMTPDEKVVAKFPSLTRDPAEFLAFLKTPAPTASASLK